MTTELLYDNCAGCMFRGECKMAIAGQRGIASCPRFWPQPAGIADWVRRWRFVIRNKVTYWRYCFAEWRHWRRFVGRCGTIPSVLKAGDVIAFTYPDDIELQCGGKPGTVHHRKILRIWTELHHTHEGWRLIVMATTATDDPGKRYCGGSGNCIDLELPRKIISINGKTTTPRY